jgi:hypothetical protein
MPALNISIAITNSWENWDILIDDDAPDEITEDWLKQNPDKWELSELTDSGGDMDMDDILITRYINPT